MKTKRNRKHGNISNAVGVRTKIVERINRRRHTGEQIREQITREYWETERQYHWFFRGVRRCVGTGTFLDSICPADTSMAVMALKFGLGPASVSMEEEDPTHGLQPWLLTRQAIGSFMFVTQTKSKELKNRQISSNRFRTLKKKRVKYAKNNENAMST